MRLLALSDLHLGHPENREAVQRIPASPADWLILAGDLGETHGHLEWAFQTLGPKFSQLIWVPGNHELWTIPSHKGADALKGEARYRSMVGLARSYGVLTPEDPYVVWPADPTLTLCPLFTLYDYTFAPDGLDAAGALAWARGQRILARDEDLLHPDPHPTRQAWSRARVLQTEARLAAVQTETLLINHWPLRQDLVRLSRIPGYSPWCGTRATTDWHRRFRARVVVSGHLHMRATDWRDGTRFEEVSLGYPRHWKRETDAAGYIRTILPPPVDPLISTEPQWRF